MFVQYLFQNRIVSPWKMLANTWALMSWPPRAETLKLVYLRGCSVRDVESWFRTVWKNGIIHRIYKGWHEVIPRLQADGHEIVLLSGTPRPLAQPLMDLFHIRQAVCAEPEIIDGYYTGRLLRPHPIGNRKVTYASEWLTAHGRGWDTVVAMGDHWGDRFLLDRAHPVAIQPRPELARYARQRNWPIVDDANDGRQIMECFELAMRYQPRGESGEYRT
jgi:phosphoserine phosphatase